MMKILTFMILCLMMTTPYLGGEIHEARETEVPNPHSMVRKTVRRKVKVVNTDTSRESRLILKSDTSYMSRPTMDTDTKKFYSALPVEINGFQSRTSMLANFVRKTIVACGLSKKQVRKYVKLMFPSNTAVRREARRTRLEWYETITDPKTGNEQEILVKETMKQGVARVTFDYAAQHIVLHQYLSSQVHFEWKETFVKQVKMLEGKKQPLVEELDNLGGYLGIKDARMKHLSKLETLKDRESNDIQKSRDKFEAFNTWAKSEPKFVTEADLKIWPFDESVIGEEKGTIMINAARKQLSKQHDTIVAKYKKIRDSLEEKQQKLEDEHNSLPATIVYRKINSLEDRIHYFSNLAENASINIDLNLVEEEAAWMDKAKSKQIVMEEYFLGKLKGAYEDNYSFAFLHHPVMTNPSKIDAWSLAGAMTTEFSDDEEYYTLPRNNEKSKYSGSINRMRIKDITDLSNAHGLPTRIVTDNESRGLKRDELRSQFLESEIKLSLPTGVLRLLGQQMNSKMSEGEHYRSHWTGEFYDLMSPTHTVFKKETEKKELNEFVDSLAEFDFS